MPIDTVVARVDLATNEPLRVGRFPLQDIIPPAKPAQLASRAAPKAFRVRDTPRMLAFVIIKTTNVPRAEPKIASRPGLKDALLNKRARDA
jgi:hypothetical protein